MNTRNTQQIGREEIKKAQMEGWKKVLMVPNLLLSSKKEKFPSSRYSLDQAET